MSWLNLFKTSISIIALVAMSTGFANRENLQPLEDSIEANNFTVSLSADGIGTLAARACDSCPMQILNITADSKLFLNRVATPMTLLNEGTAGMRATVIHDIGSNNVDRIYIGK